MNTYAIQKDVSNKRVGRKKMVIGGYEMKPNLKKHPSMVSVDHVTIVSPNLYENTLLKQFRIAYKKLFKKVILVLEEDSTGTDSALALDEVAKMKAILKEKYKHHVSKKEYHKMWKKLSILQSELQQKQEMIRNIDLLVKSFMMQNNYEEERGKSR